MNTTNDDEAATAAATATNNEYSLTSVEDGGGGSTPTRPLHHSSPKDIDEEEMDPKLHSNKTLCVPRVVRSRPIVQKLSGLVISVVVCWIVKECLASSSKLQGLWTWMEEHPVQGLVVYVLLYPLHMILLLPGAPLVLGCGFVLKLRYGWICGIGLCSTATLLGSLLGSIACFYLGRYWFRTAVRKWSRKQYPIFDAIDAAVSVNGFKVMCLLYLTPVLPLAPTSYMIGTTSMPIKPFALAKIAALPNTIVHAYVGAAAGTLLVATPDNETTSASQQSPSQHPATTVALSPPFIIASILISIGMIVLLSMKMKKELQTVLNEQNKASLESNQCATDTSNSNSLSKSTTTTTTTTTRQRIGFK